MKSQELGKSYESGTQGAAFRGGKSFLVDGREPWEVEGCVVGSVGSVGLETVSGISFRRPSENSAGLGNISAVDESKSVSKQSKVGFC